MDILEIYPNDPQAENLKTCTFSGRLQNVNSIHEKLYDLDSFRSN